MPQYVLHSFLLLLNVLTSRAFSKANLETIKLTTDLPASYSFFKYFSKIYEQAIFNVFWKNYFKISVASEKVSVPNAVSFDKWTNVADSGKVFGTLFTDLSKPFVCICHVFFFCKFKSLLCVTFSFKASAERP